MEKMATSRPQPYPSRVASGVYETSKGKGLLSGNMASLQLMDALPTAILLVESQGEILHANRLACELLQSTVSDLVGKSIQTLLGPVEELMKSQGRRIQRIGLPTGKQILVGYRVTMAEGNSPVNEPSSFLLVFDDESPWERLTVERDRLMRLAAVGEVLPAVLHELKNPLAAVTSSIEVLVEETRDSDLERDLSAILSELRRMRLTLDGVGTMGAKLRTARLHPIYEAITDACQVLTRSAATSGVTLTADISPLPPLSFDPAVVRALVFNLVQNAVQACQKGGLVRLKAGLVGERFSLVVEDSGCGMSAEVLARCKDLFFTTKPRGSGIGLSLCNQIVEEARGKLEISSCPGAGTTIRVEIPWNGAADARVGARND